MIAAMLLATATPQAAAPARDVVVEGYRARKPRSLRLGAPSANDAIRNRQSYEYAERLAACAVRGHLSGPSRLRAVVDGAVNTADHAAAQDRLARIYVTCGESPTLASFTSAPQSVDAAVKAVEYDSINGGVTDPSPLGHSIYDRGAFTIQALKRYAPDLELTPAETADPAAQARLNEREGPLNRHRLPEDFDYFLVAVCMVRVAPELSVQLAYIDGGARFGDVQEALVDRARACVGGAKQVRVDPTQFRLYIADAVYRWAVAARGVDTLIEPPPRVR